MVRVRTSWLSREAALALAFYPLFIGYLFVAHADVGTSLALALGWLSALVAAATLFATSMIYACLRTIRQWRTPLTPLNFMLIALSLGGLTQLAFLPAVQAPLMVGTRTCEMTPRREPDS